MVIRAGVTGLERARVMYLLDLFEGRGRRSSVFGECGLGSIGSWSFSKKWVRNLGTKSVLK